MCAYCITQCEGSYTIVIAFTSNILNLWIHNAERIWIWCYIQRFHYTICTCVTYPERISLLRIYREHIICCPRCSCTWWYSRLINSHIVTQFTLCKWRHTWCGYDIHFHLYWSVTSWCTLYGYTHLFWV